MTEQAEHQQERISGSTSTTGTSNPKCTCCDPKQTLIRNSRLPEKLVCPQTGHVYEKLGDNWVDTGITVQQYLNDQGGGDSGDGDFIIDPGAGGSDPSVRAVRGTDVDLHENPFASNADVR